ncbi:PD-(D/E)XK nuclease family protein [Flavonifractor plautii]|nr:PD-(D/E)XK nuclease family protein [Flavonifractor plautii]
MSASRMDKYKSCHFSYFMQYGLKAEPRRAAGFQAPEYGTFVHYVLEHVLRACRERGGVKEVPEEELRTLAQAAVERYVSQELGGMEHETARFRYLFRRLLKSVYAVVDNVAEELRSSQFQPISFELGFGAGKDLPPVELSVDGMTVSISGFVDRVDGWEHDGRLYLRVVDYKTGRKTFDLTDIWNGMGLQMLLYLFTLEREGNTLYNREIIPSGVLYLPARDAVVAGSRAMSEAERRRKVDAELRRRGIVLDEPEVLAAMEEPGEAGIRFLPVKVNKAGAITGEALVSAERLGKLARHTGRILEEIGRELAAGNIAADPFWRGPDHNACQWCEYAAACHFEEGRGGDRRRFLPAVRGEEFWQAVAKEQV